jgi:hypothetical protein
MDCRNFKELLDSYLCGELTVETNHAMLGHAEHCGPCRNEMAARRRLREALRRACSKETMSAEASERLRARLRAEARSEEPASEPATGASPVWGKLFDRFLARPFGIPATAFAALLILAGAALGLYLLDRDRGSGGQQSDISKQPGAVEPASRIVELSQSLMDEAAGDHRVCAAKFASAIAPPALPDSIKALDPAYADLDQALGEGAKGLALHSAHVCGFGGRRFLHLVYTRDSHLISLLVTERDARAMKPGDSPAGDGSLAGLQQASRDSFALSAYQTAKRVVLVVSNLSGAENKELTERLAAPVAEHLRRAEREVSWERPKLRELIAGLIRF